jgi:hypothetical protein
VDDVLRRRLIEALKSRHWASLDAERTAAAAAGVYQDGDTEWKVWRTEVGADPSFSRVARQERALCIYNTLLEGRARDMANALNELERSGSDATGTP